MINGFIPELHAALSGPLPGREAQYRMAPSLRPAGDLSFDGSRFTPSGVLILLFPREEELCTAFILRTGGGPHGGQMSLPGGKREEGDPDLIFTALREAAEEIGIDRQGISILGTLTPLYVPHSNYCIQPVVGFTGDTPSFRPNPDEVEKIVTVPLQTLFSPANRRSMSLPHRSGNEIMAPYYDAGGHVVWGATAMIISEFEVLVTSCISG